MKPADNTTEAVLRARATALARPAEVDRAAGPGCLFISFRVGRSHYALDPVIAREVWPVADIARVPGRTPGLLGLIKVRGRLLPLFDLAQTLQLETQGEGEPGFVIVANDDHEEIGLRVDAVDGIRHVALSDIKPAAGAAADACICGGLPDGTEILDGPAILTAVTWCSSDTQNQTGGES
jgi:chemotaxis signal transduction protein